MYMHKRIYLNVIIVHHKVRGCSGACRGVTCEAAFSPTFSATPFSPTFGATPKILSATPDFEDPQS